MTGTATATPSAKPSARTEFIRDSPAGALARFLTGCTSQPMDRCAAAAMLTFSMWQNAAGPITATVPSAILLNAGDLPIDPIDHFVDDFVFGHALRERHPCEAIQPGSAYSDSYYIKGMRLALKCLNAARPGDDSNSRSNIEQFHKLRTAYCGPGPCTRYAKAWSDILGWLTGREERCVLRLFNDEDHESLRDHILTQASCIHHPTGFHAQDLRIGSKSLALSGSLNAARWDDKLASGLLETGWPILFLPHATPAAMTVPSPIKLQLAVNLVASCRRHRWINSDGTTCGDAWTRHHYRALADRLRFTPPDHAFHVQRVVRELPQVCTHIAISACSGWGNDDASQILGQDLFHLTLRSVLLGVAALAYHGWGFETQRPRDEVAALLTHLRTGGPASRRDLQRRFPKLGANERDTLIERLASEGLVVCEGSQVIAVPLGDFFRDLQARPEHPMPATFSHSLLGTAQDQDAALPVPV